MFSTAHAGLFTSPPHATPEPPSTEAAVADLAGVMAHRLRSLVAGIQCSAELLVDTVYTADDRALVLQILDGAASIERLLADLLRYGHDTPPLVQPVVLPELIAGTLDALGLVDLPRPDPPYNGDPDRLGDRDAGDMFPAAGAIWSIAAPLPPVVLRADPVLLRQALLALLANALEATASQADAPVAVEVQAGEGEAIIVLENGGEFGVEPRERAFEPFVTTKAQNLGLGLPLARRIARLHGGDLVLESLELTAGIGPSVRFRLILPVASTGASAHVEGEE